MKKNLYLTILTIVTVCCIIFGSIYHILGWGFSFLDTLLDFPHFSSNKESAGSVIQSDDIDLDDFSSIDADVNVMDLDIEAGKSAAISYKCNSKLKPKYTVENDTLILTQSDIYRFWGNKKCSVTITVPEDRYYEFFDIQADVGDVDIIGINGETLTLSVDVGDIDVSRCTFDGMDVRSDVGDVDVENCEFTALDIDCSVGSICVVSAISLSDYYIDMSTSIGEVEFNGHDYRRHYTQDGSSGGRSVTLYNDTGDVELSDR